MIAVFRVGPTLLRNIARAPQAKYSMVNKGTVATIKSAITVPPVVLQQNLYPGIRNNTTLNNAPSGKRIRRRRGRESLTQSTNNSFNGVGKVSNSINFLSASKKFLSRTEEALEPMKHLNDVFIIKRDSNKQGENLTLTLKPGEGNYVLQIDQEMLTLTLVSPMSGTYTYVLCPRTGSFIGMDDGHALVGMLVRDLIRHCNGVPQF